MQAPCLCRGRLCTCSHPARASNSVARWPAEPIEPTAKVVLSPLDFAYAISDLMSVIGRSLAIATDSGALAPADRHEVLLDPVRHLLHRHRCSDEGRGIEEQRIPVGRRLGDSIAADDAVAARPVLDDERLAHLVADLLRERPARLSRVAPGGNGMTIRTGRLGRPWLIALLMASDATTTSRDAEMQSAS